MAPARRKTPPSPKVEPKRESYYIIDPDCIDYGEFISLDDAKEALIARHNDRYDSNDYIIVKAVGRIKKSVEIETL